MPVYEGSVEGISPADPWEDFGRPLAERRAGSLNLDEAQDIAARRLRELAIRLGDEDADDTDDDGDGDHAPFDADRHFRSRLAERIAGLEDRQPEPGTSLKAHERTYSVTEALPLSAFGGRLTALAHVPSAVPALPAPQPQQIGFLEVLDRTIEPHDSETTASSDKAEPTETFVTGAGDEREVRLADLIQEQRTLLDRLSAISLSYDDSEPAPLDDAMSDRARLDAAVDDFMADAEHLFDAGTHSAEPLRDEAAEIEEHDAPAPISAEQLIAALKDATASLEAQGGPQMEPRGSTASDLASYSNSDRPPIIIERARAELTALANGEIPQLRPHHSGAVGFIAGLSLSVMIGIGIYFAL
ncbi:MAG: hypothetical protein ACM31O_18635 [Bacteroidota bacterium]